jgi:aminoglycoside phosphotransferase
MSGCRFDQTASVQIERAKARAEAGLVDADDFDDRFRGKPISEVLSVLDSLRPATENLAFTHGDYCLPNILLDPTTYRISGFIDLSRAGIADRYQDIALAARSLRHNFGPGNEARLWNALKLDKPDHDKLSFYLALDEFF